ncbi:sigma-70 family RNA polymerase sigma factor [Luteolibacter pohnpeiensis]|uniref:Sigma-70 family RNA polymerase sigma factor n=1 Tax=Luteolibacter pohnpeiensis TaxID=454153 RepID=A0A934VVY3_9BACT|nr:sigma-70 family RNA polymerase sigma factor [Luteolibacter pohnpeiensis]MBK1882248.1 sigma-70 family RNA polymerase sigma factor [Luteolibacter pohnpeiensis]
MPDDRPPLFCTTRWTLVSAARSVGEAESGDALEELCRIYWIPVYAVVRQAGHQVADAQDLTQEFFQKLLEKRWLDIADPNRGRFRAFLITTLKRFLINQWHHQNTVKRGGGIERISLDFAHAENLIARDQLQSFTPEQLFDRRWVLTLLDRAMQRLADDYQQSNRAAEFATLKPCLVAENGEVDYAELADRLGVREGAARVAVHRLRKRYRACFREEVASTVADDQEIETEMRELRNALSGGPPTHL